MVKGDGGLSNLPASDFLPLIQRHFNTVRDAVISRGVEIMGVIGRLDEQVNEIIIKPIGTGNRAEREKPQASSQKHAPQPQAGELYNPVRKEEKPEQPSSKLPVWLL